MQSDFGDFMMALLNKEPFEIQWHDDAMFGVVIASDGYPGEFVKGTKLPDLDVLNGIDVFHAGTKAEGENFIGNGGRVLLAVSKAKTLKEARDHVYNQLNHLEWNGFFYRTDIGWRTFHS
jgi:phosphoribosylamine--glycine ligase